MPPIEMPVIEIKPIQSEPRDSQPAYRWTEDSRIVRVNR